MRELAYLVPVALGIGPAAWFRLRARGLVHEVGTAPARPVALVLGAKLLRPGVPTTLLVHRLEAAARLVELKKAERLVLTGLAEEVETMQAWLRARGVADDRVALDCSSARTIESFAHARKALGLTAVAVVTNPFHLPRSLYLARAAGLDAIGIAARPGMPVSARTMARNWAREAAASLRAVWDVAVR
ncbi:MAG TPA: ElyC/SanA/YdcF family protein [Myxococcales bacterium]|jgi:vancomycin permeability regulator SanA